VSSRRVFARPSGLRTVLVTLPVARGCGCVVATGHARVVVALCVAFLVLRARVALFRQVGFVYVRSCVVAVSFRHVVLRAGILCFGSLRRASGQQAHARGRSFGGSAAWRVVVRRCWRGRCVECWFPVCGFFVRRRQRVRPRDASANGLVEFAQVGRPRVGHIIKFWRLRSAAARRPQAALVGFCVRGSQCCFNMSVAFHGARFRGLACTCCAHACVNVRRRFALCLFVFGVLARSQVVCADRCFASQCVAMRVCAAFLVLSLVGALRLSPAAPALDTITGVFEHAPVELHESRGDVEATSAIMRQLGAQSGPVSPAVSRTVEPARHHAIASCDRDFAQPCPDQFEAVGAGKCAPGAGYQGPCGGGAHSFDGLSAAAKERWSEMCLAWWPCVACRRDFAVLCPGGWVVDAGARCKPTVAYAGPCGAPVDFAGYTRDMFAQWSSGCGAHWPCAGSAGGDA